MLGIFCRKDFVTDHKKKKNSGSNISRRIEVDNRGYLSAYSCIVYSLKFHLLHT